MSQQYIKTAPSGFQVIELKPCGRCKKQFVDVVNFIYGGGVKQKQKLLTKGYLELPPAHPSETCHCNRPTTLEKHEAQEAENEENEEDTEI